MTEKEKMLLGKIYDPSDIELATLRKKAHDACRKFNTFSETDEKRNEYLKAMGISPEEVYLQGPIYFDYGCFTHFGKGCYANFNFTILDCAPVTIGDNVFFGPNVSIYTPVHPLMGEERKMYLNDKGILTDKEYAKSIQIDENCWIAGNVVVCGGVHIGKNCVIGAGSVVIRDIPDNSFAAGNPCKVIRLITEQDSIYLKKDLF